MNRRKFIGLMGAAALAPAAAKGIDLSRYDVQDFNPETFTASSERILPRSLKKGSKIGITAPASPSSPWGVTNGVNTLKKLGYVPILGDTITKNINQNRYFSAPDEQRAEEFMNFIIDENIDAIICARGGYGVMRIMPMLDFEAIRKNPKIIMGYSDITALLVAVNSCCNITTFHGPLASSAFNAFTLSNFKKAIAPPAEFEPFEIVVNDAYVAAKGSGEGKLVGGNLSLVVSGLGTPFEINTKDSILFLEEVSEHPYKIDRMITQLLLANKIQESRGVIFGQFKGFNQRRNFDPNLSYTIREVIDQLIKPTGKPCMVNFPLGHSENILTLPLGVQCIMDTERKSLKILESAVTA